MKKIRPHPWELPGYRFFVPGFPPGFEPSPVEVKRDYTIAIQNLKKGQETVRAKSRAEYAKERK